MEQWQKAKMDRKLMIKYLFYNKLSFNYSYNKVDESKHGLYRASKILILF